MRADDDRLALASAEAMHAADRALRTCGIVLDDVGPGRATATMLVVERMLNGHGMCHGGFVFILADTAFAYACNSYGEVTLASAADVVFVAPAYAGEELVAEAVERSRYGRSGVYDVTVRRVTDRALVAEFRGTSRATGRPISTGDPGRPM